LRIIHGRLEETINYTNNPNTRVVLIILKKNTTDHLKKKQLHPEKLVKLITNRLKIKKIVCSAKIDG